RPPRCRQSTPAIRTRRAGCRRCTHDALAGRHVTQAGLPPAQGPQPRNGRCTAPGVHCRGPAAGTGANSITRGSTMGSKDLQAMPAAPGPQQRACLAAAVALALALGSTPALAVSNVESNASIPFSFSNPGARSLGMGGAFLGLADDATAAYTNPAGLVGLGLEKQFSIEARHTGFDNNYAAGGQAGSDPFDIGGVNYRTASDSATSLSFLGFVWPSERWS